VANVVIAFFVRGVPGGPNGYLQKEKRGEGNRRGKNVGVSVRVDGQKIMGNEARDHGENEGLGGDHKGRRMVKK
jgi:hypothetical protein